MNNEMSLNSLAIGQRARVVLLNSTGLMRRRLLDLGVIQGTIIEALQEGPSGDPIAYLIRGAVIALRSEVSSMIIVEII